MVEVQRDEVAGGVDLEVDGRVEGEVGGEPGEGCVGRDGGVDQRLQAVECDAGHSGNCECEGDAGTTILSLGSG